MDAYQLSRNNAFGPYASKYDRGIEIGPSYRPTFPKALGYQVTVIDHCSAPDLVEKYKNIPFIPEELVAQIEPVDIVWTGSTYRDLPGLIGAADYVAACHVIEHARDVCGFLKDCSALL